MNDDFVIIQKVIFKPVGLEIKDFCLEKEGSKYDACSFKLNQLNTLYRNAKVTPKKPGLFVTLWKRSVLGPIEPYNESDKLDLVIINARCNKRLGHFVFPKQILINKGILTTDLKDGKRGFRVYPPWESNLNKQAAKSQKWQVEFFLPIDLSEESNKNLTKRLYHIK